MASRWASRVCLHPIWQGPRDRRVAALELWLVDDANASIEVDAQRQKQTRRNMSDGLGQCRMGSAVALSPEEGKDVISARC